MLSDFNIQEFDLLGSTQDMAKTKMSEGELKHFDVIIARKQTAGRGRLGRTWLSERGGLYLTVAFKLPKVKAPEQWAQMSYVTGIALYEAISQTCSTCHPKLKWVNDVLIYGQKVAGILLENLDDEFLLVGIGVNIESVPELDAVPNAVALDKFCKNIYRDEFIKNLLVRLQENYEVWCIDGFIPIRSMWLHLALGIGTLVQVKLGEEVSSGIFVGIDEIGRLRLLADDGKMYCISAGEMFFKTTDLSSPKKHNDE
jgi:BirA family biotin operon repressor/biotin-[acetyl-CoA-carboxylase] ligase